MGRDVCTIDDDAQGAPNDHQLLHFPSLSLSFSPPCGGLIAKKKREKETELAGLA